MDRCPTCGRSLVGQRADHPELCAILEAMKSDDPPLTLLGPVPTRPASERAVLVRIHATDLRLLRRISVADAAE